MTNLLRETVEAVESSKHTPEDIVYIGSRDGYSCTWEEFVSLADVEYDSGFGGQEVASDLEVIFSDGGTLHRGEYDGSEWWGYTPPFMRPAEHKPIRHLVPPAGYWGTLAEIHENADD